MIKCTFAQSPTSLCHSILNNIIYLASKSFCTSDTCGFCHTPSDWAGRCSPGQKSDTCGDAVQEVVCQPGSALPAVQVPYGGFYCDCITGYKGGWLWGFFPILGSSNPWIVYAAACNTNTQLFLYGSNSHDIYFQRFWSGTPYTEKTKRTIIGHLDFRS